MINVQIKKFIISYPFISKFCWGFLILSLCCPPPHSMHFSSPAVCICCDSLSLALSLLCTSTISPLHSSVYVCHLSLSPSCWEYSLLLPLPQYVHSSCIFLCHCSAHEPFLSSSYWHSYTPSSACLPSCPLLLFFIPSFLRPLSLLIFILFSLPSFWYSGSFCLLIYTTLLSGSPLYHFSPVLSDLFSQIDSTGKMFLFAGVCKPALQPFQRCVKSEVVSLICRESLLPAIMHTE